MGGMALASWAAYLSLANSQPNLNPLPHSTPSMKNPGAKIMAEETPILQYVMYGNNITWGTRVFANGRVDAYTDREVSFTDAAEFRARLLPLRWRSRTQLSATDIQKLRKIITDSEFFRLPSLIGGEVVVQDGSKTVWNICLNGKTHEVIANGADAARDPTLENLRVTFETFVAEALSRDEPATPTPASGSK
jgi:hypothetical protein